MTAQAVVRVNPDRKPKNRGGARKKITPAQLDHIVIKYNEGATQKELAEQYSVSVETIRRYLKTRE